MMTGTMFGERGGCLLCKPICIYNDVLYLQLLRRSMNLQQSIIKRKTARENVDFKVRSFDLLDVLL